MHAGTTLTLAAPNYVAALPEPLRNDSIKTLNVALQVAADFNEALAAIAADHHLTAQGRASAGTRAAAAALATLTAIESTTIKQLIDRSSSIEQALRRKATYPRPNDPTERISHELQVREIRDQLRELPASERLHVYQTTSDPLVLAAIDSAPPTLSAPRPDGSRRLEPFIDPAARSAAVLARAEAADPATAQTWHEVRAQAEVYRLAVGSVRTDILDEVPDAKAPAIITL